MGIFPLSQAYQFKTGSPKDMQNILYSGTQKTTPQTFKEGEKIITQLEATRKKA